ncbi:hypothetical protein IMZ48_15750 [Candidatus Bathyarchaeota archaeon]|nr:hypothetical protein [Candidatus Bathyarchaeota archaeon]
MLVSGPPDDETGGVTPPTVDDKEISLNGVADDAHEDFSISRKTRSGFCKTLQKPYDLVVACILLRMYMNAPNNVKVS